MIPRILVGTLFLLFSPLLAEQAPLVMKEAPKRPSFEADVVLEDSGFLDECAPEMMCVEGLLVNSGSKPAYNVRLTVEIGGTKRTKPRVVLPFKVEQTTMQPGDRQEFAFKLDRKVTTKRDGKEKVVEVGRYNFKIVPKWSSSPVAMKKKQLGKRK